MGLRTKLVIAVLGTAIVALAAGVFSASQYESQLLRRESQVRGQEIMRALTVPCAVALAQRELEQLDVLIARFSEAEGRDLDLEWLAVIDETGRFLAHTDPRRFGQRADDEFTEHARGAEHPVVATVQGEGAAALLLSMPIVTGPAHGGIRWGTMSARMSLARVEARLASDRALLLLGGAGGVLVLAGLLWYLLSRAVVEPVLSLSRTAVAIAGGDLGARARLPGGGHEVAALGQTFNAMAEQIERHTRDLEQRVAERTQELASANERLAELARTDGLTGLKNHRSFHESLDQELARARALDQTLSVVILDVDHFKAYNDTHGHPAGDEVLRQAAQVFRSQVRSSDFVGRYGGEEFAIILVGSGKADAERIAEKLRRAVEQHDFPMAEQSQPLGRLTVSVGVSAFPVDATQAPELVAAADRALYEAKKTGRNRVVSCPEAEACA